MIEVIWR